LDGRACKSEEEINAAIDSQDELYLVGFVSQTYVDFNDKANPVKTTLKQNFNFALHSSRISIVSAFNYFARATFNDKLLRIPNT
jgi:hypothetical protein